MVVTNLGPTPATGVNWYSIHWIRPSNLFRLQATQGACQHTGTSPGGLVTCSIGSLAAGTSATITLRIVPTVVAHHRARVLPSNTSIQPTVTRQ
jgi:hypothetical protein